MRRLVLVRHGESIYNAEARVQGQQCAGLSELGHAQAKATAAAVALAYPDARLFVSDLQRTRETIAPLAEAFAQEPVQDERLRERSFGVWEGHLRSEVVRDEPDRWQRWLQGEDVIGEIGGETSEELVARVLPVFTQLLADTPDGSTTIVVTHGGPVWHGVHRMLELDRPIFAGVNNCSITELSAGSSAVPMLRRWNEVGHLPVDLREGWLAPVAATDGPPVGR